MSTGALRSVVADDGAQPESGLESAVRGDAVLLSALETTLRHTIERFTVVSGRVTEQVLTLGDAAGTGLIVALQDLDRLQQEFGALSGIFSYCVDSWCGGAAPHQDERGDPIAAITLADLKHRLSNRLRSEALMMDTQTGAAPEDIF